MDLDVLFLGTAGSHPTAGRNTSATLLRRGGERILVDCGEGTQRRLMQSVAGFGDIGTILLTHGHGDHYLGLPGMLRTWALRERDVPLALYGPPGTRALMRTLEPLVGRLPVPAGRRRDRARRRGARRRLPLRGVAGRATAALAGLDARRRTSGPGRFDVDEARRARRARGAAVRAAAARGGRATGRRHGGARRRARGRGRGAAAASCCPATRGRATPCSPPRSAPTC